MTVLHFPVLAVAGENKRRKGLRPEDQVIPKWGEVCQLTW